MAYEFLLGILTPAAQDVVKTQPEAITTAIVVIPCLIALISFCGYICYATRKPGKKPEQKGGQKSGPELQSFEMSKLGQKKGFVQLK